MKINLSKMIKKTWCYLIPAVVILYITIVGKVGLEQLNQPESLPEYLPEPNVQSTIRMTTAKPTRPKGRPLAAFSALREFLAHNLSRLAHINTTKYFNKSSKPTPLVPHIIHQIWDSYNIPEEFKNWVTTWPKFHPKWHYWFWTHQTFRRLLELVDPVFLKDYDSYKSGQARADVMRFYIIYYFGGVYADLDMRALRPLDTWTYTNHCVLPEETYAHPFILNNATHSPAMITLLLCRPGHPFFKMAIDHIQEYTTRKYNKKLLFVDDVYQAYLKDTEVWKYPENHIYLAPPKYFLPTWDPGQYNTLKYRCTAKRYISIMTKKQKMVCYTLHKEQWINRPTSESYTDHHWVHVVMNESGWKGKKSVPITNIIPNIQFNNVNKAIDDLKARVNRSNTNIWDVSRKRHNLAL